MAPIVLPDPPIPFLVQQANIKTSLGSRLASLVLLDTFALKVHRTIHLDLTIVLLDTIVLMELYLPRSTHVISELTTVLRSVIA